VKVTFSHMLPFVKVTIAVERMQRNQINLFPKIVGDYRALVNAVKVKINVKSIFIMPRLHLTVLTTRNETWRLWKRISKFYESNFMSAILSRLSILFIYYTSRDLDNKKILSYKLFVRYLVVKQLSHACKRVPHSRD